jgi:hypothetical protein
LGSYEVDFSGPGFGTEVRKGITLTIGRELVVDANLKPGAISQSVEVTGEAPAVETTNASLAYLVDERKMTDLPLNGRSYVQLATLQPGVNGVNQDRHDASGGYGSEVSIAGGQTTQNSFLLDGQDILDSGSRTPGSAVGTNLGIDAIREFTILVDNYGVDRGLVLGGVVNVATRSGTNTLHGSGFEFIRNSAVDAKNYFDLSNAPIPAFRRNQFGGTIGGPIKKDKTFFLAAYEGLRQAQASTLLSPVPNAAAHGGCLPKTVTDPNPTATDPQCASFSGVLKFIGVTPLMAPRMNDMPLPNGADNGDGTGQYTSNPLIPSREDYVLGRVDHQFSNNDSLYGRYVFDRAVVERAEKLPIFAELNRTKNQYFTLHWTHVFSDHLINDARVGYNRSPIFFTGLNLGTVPESQLNVVTGSSIGLAWLINSPNIDTGSSGGGFDETPRTFILNLMEYGDDASYTYGIHTVKFGALLNRYQLNTAGGGRGQLIFDNLQKFMQGLSSELQTPYSGLQHWRSTVLGFYVEDDIRLTRRFTVNLGLREEFMTSMADKDGLVALTDKKSTALTYGQPLFTPDKKNIQPRVGIAWDVFGNGKTAVRGGFGIFSEQPVPSSLRGACCPQPDLKNPASFTQSFFGAPQPLVTLNASGLPGDIIEYQNHAKNASKYQWSLDVQQQITPNTSLSVAYLGARYTHLMMITDGNPQVPLKIPGANPRNPSADGNYQFLAPFCNPSGVPYTCGASSAPNASWSLSYPLTYLALLDFNWEGWGTYHSLQANLVHRFSKGLQFQSAYTWSHTIDLTSNTWAGAISQNGPDLVPKNPYNLSDMKGNSNYDIRHIFSGNLTYDLPFGRNTQNFTKQAINGWQVNLIGSFSTGLPITLGNGVDQSNYTLLTPVHGDYPNFASGFSSIPTSGVSIGCVLNPAAPVAQQVSIKAGTQLGTPSLFFDPCAFAIQPPGTIGAVGKNPIVGPHLWDLDFMVGKRFPITERVNLNFRIEAFNILNHPNFDNMNRTLFVDGTGTRNGSAGQLTTPTATSSRQLQMGLKLSF